VIWEEPRLARFLEQLSRYARLIVFDKRGTGLSDRVSEVPSLEVCMDDVRAVMASRPTPKGRNRSTDSRRTCPRCSPLWSGRHHMSERSDGATYDGRSSRARYTGVGSLVSMRISPGYSKRDLRPVVMDVFQL
jgi:hypothetical protein